jgi:hypothetical protein
MIRSPELVGGRDSGGNAGHGAFYAGEDEAVHFWD